MSVHSPMAPSICLLTTGLHSGGAERQVVDLAKELKRRGWSVSVISMLPKGALAQELEDCSIPVKSLEMLAGVPDPRAIFRLRRLVREQKPDLIHSHMVHANLLARVARLFKFVPACICTAHSMNEGSRFREIAYRFTDSLAYATTIISQEAARRYSKVRAVSPRKLLVIPNGVDCRRFTPDADARARVRNEFGVVDKFVWIAVGRIEDVKNYPAMLRCFSAVRLAHPESALLIAGDGVQRRETEILADSLGLQGSIRFLGLRNDISELMNAADALVLASKWEGLPLVLLEAAACGLPIVATQVGGNAEVVSHGITGLLVPGENEPALISAMESMMETESDARIKMGSEGRARAVAKFGLDSVVSRWEELYLAAIAGRSFQEIPSISPYGLA